MNTTVTGIKKDFGFTQYFYTLTWLVETQVHLFALNTLELMTTDQDTFRFLDEVDLEFSTEPTDGLVFRCAGIVSRNHCFEYQFDLDYTGIWGMQHNAPFSHYHTKLTLNDKQGLYNFNTKLYVTPRLV